MTVYYVETTKDIHFFNSYCEQQMFLISLPEGEILCEAGELLYAGGEF